MLCSASCEPNVGTSCRQVYCCIIFTTVANTYHMQGRHARYFCTRYSSDSMVTKGRRGLRRWTPPSKFEAIVRLLTPNPTFSPLHTLPCPYPSIIDAAPTKRVNNMYLRPHSRRSSGRFDEIWVLPVYQHMFSAKRDAMTDRGSPTYEDRIEMCR